MQVGARYEPLFPYFAGHHPGDAFKVLSDGYVTDDSGTGVVHQAPAFGEDDYRWVGVGGWLVCPLKWGVEFFACFFHRRG